VLAFVPFFNMYRGLTKLIHFVITIMNNLPFLKRVSVAITALSFCLSTPGHSEEQTVSVEILPAKAETVETKQAREQEAEHEAELKVEPENAQPPETTLTVEELRSLIEEQRSALDEQDRKIQEQEKLLQDQQAQIEQQKTSLENHVTVLNSLQTQLDQLAMAQGQQSAASEEDKALLTRLQTLEEHLAAIPEDPTLSRDQEIQPGSILLPGTNASLKIGGYVKLAFIKSFDPLASVDRFIVGAIPVTSNNEFSFDESHITSSQSRLNLDLIDSTDMGNFRAFVEGDFAGSGDTFRMRHAYGQFRDVLAGKTWSVFYDPVASPEELDFEGINGQVSVRQSQARYFPSIGKDWDLSIAVEDPVAQISTLDPETNEVVDADGVSDQPDITFSIRKNFKRLSHVRFAGVLRQISARPVAGESTETEFAWGVNVSGVVKTPRFGELDNLKFQLIYGEGIGRYVNDLNTLGGYDGVFDTEGNIKTLPVLAGFAAYQHWWTGSMRSTFLFSGVYVDNYSFQADDAYKKTERVSGNLIFSPVPRFDVGMEVIWGKRTNEDNQSGDAIQTQISTRYRF
jgi:hypothetical protein